MTNLDTVWAGEQLQRFQSLSGDYRAYDSQVADGQAVVVEAILDRLLSGWRNEYPAAIRFTDSRGRYPLLRQLAARAGALAQRMDELAGHLGDSAPSLSTSVMHRWVWDGARSLWSSGHYREAVRAATVTLNAQTQSKLGRRDVSEQQLFQEAFSKDPPTTDRPRLRLAEGVDDRTGASIHRGVAALAEGMYAAVRNPTSHDPGELVEEEALEQLAALSMLVRFVDRANLQRVEPSQSS